ncbi:MAG: protein kinase [Lachnospiraceae bacterium]|nr:protein kinase [Lachnospiraceae bacterium]
MEKDILSEVWPEWTVEKKIGKGAYGIVYEAVRTDHSVKSKAAIKVITIPENESEMASLRAEGLSEDDTKKYLEGIVNDFVKEIQLMESFKGVQNIVSVEDYKVVEKTAESEIGWTIYIRMELLTPFNDYLADKTLTEKEVIQLGIDICSALELCARQKVIHRDIKPENIFVNQFGSYKLGDFGIARKLENVTGGMSQKGTYNYMAPEVEKGGQYDLTVDLYSLGLVLYRLLNHNLLPFLNCENQLSPNGRMEAVRKRMDGAELLAPAQASPAMAQVILKACSYEPQGRYQSASEMKQALERVAAGEVSEEEDILNKTMSVRRAETKGIDPDATTAVQRAPQAPLSETKPENNRIIHVFGTDRKLPPTKLLAAVAAGLVLVILVIVLAVGGGKDKKDEKNAETEIEAQEVTPAPESTSASEGPIGIPSEVSASGVPVDGEQSEEIAVAAILEEAKKSADEGEYFVALSIIKTARGQYPENEKLEETYDSYAAEYKKTAMAEIDEKKKSGDLIGAAAKITEASAMLPEDEELKELASEIEEAQAALASLGAEEETEEDSEPSGAGESISGLPEEEPEETTGTQTEKVYLFDYVPTDVTYAYLCMLNNDLSQSWKWNLSYYFYPYDYSSDWKMQSGGKTYSKGMAITAATGYGYATEIYYGNMGGVYQKLTGKVAFEDKFIDRVDKAYQIEFYADGVLVGSYTIRKNSPPVDVEVDIDYCSDFSILLRQPSNDSSEDPNINLIDFALS